MALYTSTSDVAGLLPGDYGDLIVRPVAEAAVALNPACTNTVSTARHDLHIPILDVDSSASWVGEGDEIAPADPTLHELIVTPGKVAALTIVSSELAADTSPAAAEILGAGLARSIAAQLDAAFFGDLPAPAPAGLGSIDEADLNLIYAGATPANLDAFAQAMSLVETDGAKITAFVAAPADALTIQTIKTATGHNAPLLGVDATNGTSRQVFGVPLLVSRHATPGTIWGLAAARVLTVLREDVEVVSDSSPYFTSDRIAVRAVLRAAFAFPDPMAVAKISLTAAP